VPSAGVVGAVGAVVAVDHDGKAVQVQHLVRTFTLTPCKPTSWYGSWLIGRGPEGLKLTGEGGLLARLTKVV
jgi:hypothetical protein